MSTKIPTILPADAAVLILCAINGREFKAYDPNLQKALELVADVSKQRDNLKRHATNLYQDSCENALIELSYFDAVRQALREVAPDHPALEGQPPAFGVWEHLSKENDKLRAALAHYERTANN